jgi:putative transposase
MRSALGGLAEMVRRRRKGVAIERRPALIPKRPSQRWSIDFVSDKLDYSRRLKCLTIVDDFTKEAIDIVVDHGISGRYLANALDRAARFRSLPITIRTDQASGIAGTALDQWAYQHKVESFNGKFRDECLNEHWFRSLSKAREIITA